MKYFNKQVDTVLYENFDKLNVDLIEKLDFYRELLGYPVIVTSAYSLTGHSPNSEHGTGEAVDVKSFCTLWWQYMAATRAGFRNIGLYPEWNGLHLGIRINEIPRRWIGLGSDNTQEYISYNIQNMDKYIIRREYD